MPLGILSPFRDFVGGGINRIKSRLEHDVLREEQTVSLPSEPAAKTTSTSSSRGRSKSCVVRTTPQSQPRKISEPEASENSQPEADPQREINEKDKLTQEIYLRYKMLQHKNERRSRAYMNEPTCAVCMHRVPKVRVFPCSHGLLHCHCQAVHLSQQKPVTCDAIHGHACGCRPAEPETAQKSVAQRHHYQKAPKEHYVNRGYLDSTANSPMNSMSTSIERHSAVPPGAFANLGRGTSLCQKTTRFQPKFASDGSRVINRRPSGGRAIKHRQTTAQVIFAVSASVGMQSSYPIDERFKGRRLKCVAIRGSVLYLQPRDEDKVELWSFDTLHPTKYNLEFSVDVEGCMYTFSSCPKHKNTVFIFFAGFMRNPSNDGRIDGTIALFAYNIEKKRLKTYFVEDNQQLYRLPLEMLSMGSRSDGSLYLYDRTITSGPLPYYDIEPLEDKKDMFSIEPWNVPPEEVTDPGSRFTIAFDGARRVFGRLKDDDRLLVFNPEAENWEEYEIKADGNCPPQFDLSHKNGPGAGSSISVRSHLMTRGETMGQRVGAVESPLSFHEDADDDRCLVRQRCRALHYFYEAKLDEENRKVIWRHLSTNRISEESELMFYPKHNRDVFVFVGLRVITVVYLQVPPLQTISLLQVQSDVRKREKDGMTPEEIATVCREHYFRQKSS
ncbi:unnamed protein product [Caenorhabditis auriculariae]|uniref:Uncharacterized protein n=1 Tax=Caenorhabditis auriculariae TaxID=2777116 RepID=A0A8S1H5F9_9PELO|nr:unnamed protein product [Caenorhabditis auriculariae]